MKRTAKIVAPFIVTVAPVVIIASCAGRPAECAKTVAGTPCSESDRCAIPGHEHDCGLNGYSCRDGKWQEAMTYCNPPGHDPEPTAEPTATTAEPTATTAATTTPIGTATPTGTAVVAVQGNCRDTQVDTPCEGDARCLIQGQEHSCGLNGYECRDGKWRRLMKYCNPPRQ